MRLRALLAACASCSVCMYHLLFVACAPQRGEPSAGPSRAVSTPITMPRTVYITRRLHGPLSLYLPVVKRRPGHVRLRVINQARYFSTNHLT